MNFDNSDKKQKGQQFYEVEKIIGKRYVGKKAQYKIKWKGYDLPQDLTWQPIQNLQQVLDEVQLFNESIANRKRQKSETKQSIKNRIKQNEQEAKNRSDQQQLISEKRYEKQPQKKNEQIEKNEKCQKQAKIKFQKKQQKLSKTTIQIFEQIRNNPLKEKNSKTSQKEFSFSKQKQSLSREDNQVNDEDIQIKKINNFVIKNKRVYLDVDVGFIGRNIGGVDLYSILRVLKEKPDQFAKFLEILILQNNLQQNPENQMINEQ